MLIEGCHRVYGTIFGMSFQSCGINYCVYVCITKCVIALFRVLIWTISSPIYGDIPNYRAK